MRSLLVAEPTLDLLRAALDGSGPALLPGPLTDRVRAALRPAAPLENDDVAVVVPTSGSTGEPKGALLSAAALTASATATHDRLGGPGRWTLALPTTHVAGVQVLVRSLLAGLDPVLARDGLPPATSGGPCYTALVPTQLRRLLAARDPAPATYDAVLLGGAAADEALLARAADAGVRVVTTYGMSETSGGCVYDGRLLDGVRVQLDPTGRIRLGGPTLALGYRLRPDAPEFAGGWFATGDVGRFDADRLIVLGRVDEMIVTGGEKVAPAAVEQALAAHPSVAEVAVLGEPDPDWGAQVVAVVVLRAPLSLAQARGHVRDRLGPSAAPKRLVEVSAIPLLPSGKPDRAALRSSL